MGRPRKSDSEAEGSAVAEAPKFDFRPIPGMIRLLRRPFDLGAPRYSFKSVIGVANHNGRAIKKTVNPTPIPGGAGWEEWLVQDNPGNRAIIETGYRDSAFCYTAIYAETPDAVEKFADAVETFLGSLEKSCTDMDAKFSKLNAEAEKLEEEMQALMAGGLTEAENQRLEALNRKEADLRANRFDAEKAFRVCKAKIKAQKELLERLR